jgi:hypothetical protein
MQKFPNIENLSTVLINKQEKIMLKSRKYCKLNHVVINLPKPVGSKDITENIINNVRFMNALEK